MNRKWMMGVLLAALVAAPSVAQKPAEKPVEKKHARRVAVTPPVVALPAVPDFAVPAIPALPEVIVPPVAIPAIPAVPILPISLPVIPDIPAVPAVPVFSIAGPMVLLGPSTAGPAMLLMDDDEADDQDPKAEEQKEREREKAERDKERAEREKERAQERIERENELYDDGKEYLDEGEWDKAVQKFAQLVEMKGQKVDAGMYWLAYAYHKQGSPQKALTTVQTMISTYPNSRWIKDAKALEIEIRQGTGGQQKVDPADCDLKVYAVNALMNQDSEEAIPILEKLLQGRSDCPKVRKQALFVLAQSSSPKARDLMARIARGESNPDLQREAIRNLGIHGGAGNKQVLSEVYASSTDMDIKKQVLNAFMISGEKSRLFDAAKNEKSADLRGDAIHWLGTMGAEEELWQLYQAETSVDVKKRIIHSLSIGGKVDRIIEIAKSDKDPEIRKQAIHGLGIAGSERTSAALLTIYGTEKDREIKKQVLHSLFIQGSGRQLADIARKENDSELKKDAIHWCSLTNTKECRDLMMEILSK